MLHVGLEVALMELARLNEVDVVLVRGWLIVFAVVRERLVTFDRVSIFVPVNVRCFESVMTADEEALSSFVKVGRLNEAVSLSTGESVSLRLTALFVMSRDSVLLPVSVLVGVWEWLGESDAEME